MTDKVMTPEKFGNPADALEWSDSMVAFGNRLALVLLDAGAFDTSDIQSVQADEHQTEQVFSAETVRADLSDAGTALSGTMTEREVAFALNSVALRHAQSVNGADTRSTWRWDAAQADQVSRIQKHTRALANLLDAAEGGGKRLLDGVDAQFKSEARSLNLQGYDIKTYLAASKMVADMAERIANKEEDRLLTERFASEMKPLLDRDAELVAAFRRLDPAEIIRLIENTGTFSRMQARAQAVHQIVWWLKDGTDRAALTHSLAGGQTTSGAVDGPGLRFLMRQMERLGAAYPQAKAAQRAVQNSRDFLKNQAILDT